MTIPPGIWLHDCRATQCRAVIGHAPYRITARGPLHSLPRLCGQPVAAEGRAWCADHAAGIADPQRGTMHAPSERAVRHAAPPEEREPELTEVMQ